MKPDLLAQLAWLAHLEAEAIFSGYEWPTVDYASLPVVDIERRAHLLCLSDACYSEAAARGFAPAETKGWVETAFAGVFDKAETYFQAEQYVARRVRAGAVLRGARSTIGGYRRAGGAFVYACLGNDGRPLHDPLQLDEAVAAFVRTEGAEGARAATTRRHEKTTTARGE